jgi:AraC family transcriptional regulator, regulatory protein of adaptative response / DNA-3-methyladenine glycosylase II
VLPALLSRVRALFDLDARPDVIATRLRSDARLAPAVKANPGLRVPGAFNGFEMGLRAIVGQQVTVKAATTIAGRLVEALGEPIVTPLPELNRLTPTPARIAKASVDDIAGHAIVAARARSIIALAQVQGSGELCLDGGAHHNPDDSIKRLAELPGMVPGQRTTSPCAPCDGRRLPEGRHRGAQQPRRRNGERGRGVVTTLATFASYAVMHVWRMASHHHQELGAAR